MANNMIVNMNSAGPRSQSRPRFTFLRCLLATIFVIVLCAVYLTINYFFFPPETPIVYADSLSLSLSNLTATPSSLLSATWLLTLTVQNTNFDTYLEYDRIEASIYYGSEPYSVTTLPSFVLPRSKQITTLVTFVAAGEGMMMREKGSVQEFNVRMGARVTAWNSCPRFLRVYCEGLQVVFSGYSGEGSMVGDPRKCKTGLS